MSEAALNASPAEHAAHGPHLAHHFDSPAQQYSSAKLGMWVFLGTEILMFGGLFCAYGVYRYSHPDVFIFSHEALNPLLGGINTIVLITSSLTMALAVRFSQLGRTVPLAICLALTILGGAGFMAIKYVEYKSKWEHHLFPGRYNVYNAQFAGEQKPPEDLAHGAAGPEAHVKPATHPASAAAATQPAGPPAYFDPLAGTADEPKIKASFAAPMGLGAAQVQVQGTHHRTLNQLSSLDQQRINSFFSVYFCMTGLHGFHVLVGMGLLGWVLIRSLGGTFGPSYFTPVDLVGLYWHLVDLIWIFLFPLLYLIH